MVLRIRMASLDLESIRESIIRILKCQLILLILKGVMELILDQKVCLQLHMVQAFVYLMKILLKSKQNGLFLL